MLRLGIKYTLHTTHLLTYWHVTSDGLDCLNYNMSSVYLDIEYAMADNSRKL